MKKIIFKKITFLFLFVISNITFLLVAQSFNAKQRADQIIRQAEEKAEMEALRIRREARKKALEVVARAEKQEFEQDYEDFEEEEEEIKEDMEEGEEKEGGEQVKKDVSEEWKQEVSRQFAQDTEMIKQIIIQGETDKQEQQDFIQKLEDQKKWLDATVSGTKHFFDPNYNAVMQKKLSFGRLVKAQKKADEILQELIDEEKINESRKKRMRIIILYDLNSLIQKKVERGRAGLIETGLSEVVLRDVVNKVVGAFKEELIDVEKEVKKAVEGIEEKIEKLKKDLDQLELQKAELRAGFKTEKEQQKREFKTEIEQKNRENLELEIDLRKTKNECKFDIEQKNRAKLELEILLRKTKQNMERLEQQVQSRREKLPQEELKTEIEQKNRENLELQIRLRRLERELKTLKNEVEE